MNHQLASFLLRLYPRSWRARYGEELSDLCDELVAFRKVSPARLAGDVFSAAVGTRVRLARRTTLLAAGGALAVLAGTAAFSNGYGLTNSGQPAARWFGPHDLQTSRLLGLPRGHAQATTMVRQPGGYILLARVSAPRGVHVIVYATSLLAPPEKFSALFSTFPLVPDDRFVSCRTHGMETTCTQGGLEWCPLEPSAWRLRVIKKAGPATTVQVDFLVGSRPQGLSVGQTDSWVARFDSSWSRHPKR